MSYRLLLDEHIEQEVANRLTDAGHDIERVQSVPALGAGADDEALAEYSLETGRAVLTYDDDFISAVDRDAYHAVLFVEDDTLTAREIVRILERMAVLYPYEELAGLQKIGREWL